MSTASRAYRSCSAPVRDDVDGTLVLALHLVPDRGPGRRRSAPRPASLRPPRPWRGPGRGPGGSSSSAGPGPPWGPRRSASPCPASQRPCSRQVTGIFVVCMAASQMVTLTMRFCLPPTMVSPPKMTTGWSLVSTATVGTVPPPSSWTSTAFASRGLVERQVRGDGGVSGGAERDDDEAVALHRDDGRDGADESFESWTVRACHGSMKRRICASYGVTSGARAHHRGPLPDERGETVSGSMRCASCTSGAARPPMEVLRAPPGSSRQRSPSWADGLRPAAGPQCGRSGGRSTRPGSRGCGESPSSASQRRPYWSGMAPQPK